MGPYDMLVQEIQFTVPGTSNYRAMKIADALIDVIRDEILRDRMGEKDGKTNN